MCTVPAAYGVLITNIKLRLLWMLQRARRKSVIRLPEGRKKRLGGMRILQTMMTILKRMRTQATPVMSQLRRRSPRARGVAGCPDPLETSETQTPSPGREIARQVNCIKEQQFCAIENDTYILLLRIKALCAFPNKFERGFLQNRR